MSERRATLEIHSLHVTGCGFNGLLCFVFIKRGGFTLRGTNKEEQRRILA